MKFNRGAYAILIIVPCLFLAYAIGKPAKLMEKMFRNIRIVTGNALGFVLKNAPEKRH